MPSSRLIKRTVTEEIYDDRACPVSDIDDDDDDAIGDDDDLDDADAEQDTPPRAARGRQDRPSVGGTDAAGTDNTDLTGEEDE